MFYGAPVDAAVIFKDTAKDKGNTPPGPAAPAEGGGSDAQTEQTVGARRLPPGDEDLQYGMFDWVAGRQRKWYNISAEWEGHLSLWCQSGTCNSDNGPSKRLNYAGATLGLRLTRNDAISVSMGFYVYDIVDAGEDDGFRATDLSLNYAHVVRLPRGFTLTASAGLSAPTSFNSQKAGLITAPRASLRLSQNLNSVGFSWTFRAGTGGNIQSCTSQGGYDCSLPGGAPNVIATVGGALNVEYAFWFHRALGIGVGASDAYVWFRNPSTEQPITNVNYGYGAGNTPGAVNTGAGQPAQQSYGFEAYVTYSPPRFFGIQTDLKLAIANGDPTLGNVSRLFDGVGHIYLNYYGASEVYGAVAVRF